MSGEDLSLVSVICVSYNEEEAIQGTLDSIFMQDYPKLEVLCIDGGSKDRTYDIILENKKRINYHCSEIDGGVYFGMNKGIALAKGEFIVFLNAGDLYLSENRISKLVREARGKSFVVGQVLVSDTIKVRPATTPLRFYESFLLYSSLGHGATMFHKSFFEILGYYDTDLKIVADYDLFVKAIVEEKLSFKVLDFFVCVFFLGGISNQDENHERVLEERNLVQARYFKRPTHTRYCFYQRLMTLFRVVFLYIKDSPAIYRYLKRSSFKESVF